MDGSDRRARGELLRLFDHAAATLPSLVRRRGSHRRRAPLTTRSRARTLALVPIETPADLGESVFLSDAAKSALAEACHLDADDHAPRVELMVVLTRLVLAQHARRAARDAGPQAAHKLDSLGRALKHLHEFSEETRTWNQISPPPRQHDAGDPDALVHTWRLVELQFPTLPHGDIHIDGVLLRVGDALRTVTSVIREHHTILLPRIVEALVRAVEAAHEDLTRRLDEHPTAAVKHKPRTDGRRVTMCDLCHVFDAVHLVDREQDQLAAKVDFVQQALTVIGQELAPGTLLNRLRGPELDEYFVQAAEENLRNQGVDDEEIKTKLRDTYRSALETPPPLAFDAGSVLALVREPVIRGSAQARSDWIGAVQASGISERLRSSVVLLGQPKMP